MAEAPQTPPEGAASQAQEAPRLTIQSQYVKDLSFENPNAPKSLEAGGARPEIQIRVDVRVQSESETRHEVVLHLNIEARAAGNPTFMLELSYAGLFGLLNIPADSRQAILLIECPRMLFPFARRIVADTVRDGGFPPLMIEPIDFAGLYRRRLQEQAAAGAASGAGGDGGPTVN
ncbi:MAG: protein-export chaperone SecB [Geminicoccaceae bacterium]|nr:protein-export chaperone SecB [Geminicoccaceae bacterium]